MSDSLQNISLHPCTKLVCLIISFFVLFQTTSPFVLGLFCFAALVCLIVTPIKASSLKRAIAPLLLIFAITIIGQLLTVKSGTTLYETLLPWGADFTLTTGALIQSGIMMLRFLIALVMSISCMKSIPTQDLIWATECFALPFEKIGIRTQGPVLAFNIAFSFLPTLLEDFSQTKKALASRGKDFETGGPIQKAQAYTELIPALIIRSLRSSERLSEAIIARNFGQANRTHLNTQKFKAVDFIAFAGLTAIVILAFIF